MAGLRDTEAQVSVSVSGISELEKLNEATNSTIASLTKLDELTSRGFGMSGGANGGIGKIVEETKLASENVNRFKENLESAANSGASVAEKLQRGTSALSEQLSMSERLSASSAKIAENKAKESVANDKAVISAEKVAQAQSQTVEKANKAEISAEKLTQAQTKSAEASAKLAQEQSKASEYAVKAANAQDKETASIEKSVAAAEKLAAARQKDLALAEKYQAQTNSINQAASRSAMLGSSNGGAKREGRIKSAAKESMALFAPGMLMASGVMRGAEYVQDLFKEGAKYNSEVSGMGGTWGTLVDGARGEGISARDSGTASGIISGIQSTSRTTGRSLDLVNEGYQQMYHATENADRTKRLVHSEMMIADAMNMSDAQASRFAMYGVGHSLDRGYVTGGAMNQMVQYAPALNSALTRAYLAQKQHKNIADVDEKDVERNKGSLRDRIKNKEVSAAMLEDALNYLGDDKFKHAAENAQKTIPGMVRSFENGLPRLVGKFENSFLEPLGKASSGLFEKATKWINGTDSDKWAESVGKSLSDITVKFTNFAFEVGNGVGKIWGATSQFRSGFADGFVTEFGNIKNAVGDAAKFVGKQYQKLIDILPKGAGDKAKDIGEITGKVTAFIVALKAAKHLPVIGKPFEKLLGYASELAGKLPIIGGSLSKIIGGQPHIKAGDKMMTAADTMMAAANKMAGANGIAGASELAGGGLANKGRVVSSVGKFTLAEKMANSKFGAGVDNMFLKGAGLASKGGIKGVMGKALMASSTGIGKLGIGSANLLSRVGGTKLGGLAVGAGRVGKSIFSRGGGALNAAFAGFDIYSAMKNSKAGTKKRHEGVGSAVGAGIGGTLGAALGSFVGPVGTVAGGMAGSWLGDKAGGFVGSNWNGLMKFGDKLFNHRVLPEDKSHRNNNHSNNLFKGFHLPTLFKRTDHKSAFNRNDREGSMPKIKNPFANWKMPKLTMPKLPKMTNPFKSWKFPNLKMPKLPRIKNPFAGWKMPKINLPKIPKIKNPFKDFKFPKVKFPKLPNWLSKLNPFGHAKSSAKGANNEAKNVSKSASSANKNISKTSSAVKKAGASLGKSFNSAFNSIKSGSSKIGSSLSSGIKKAQNAAKSGAKGLTNSFKSSFKGMDSSAKGAFNKLVSSVKSGINKAKSAASSGSSGIGKAISSGLKNVNSSAKSAMSGLASSVRSGISKAKSVASSGASKIVSTINSGLSKLGTVSSSGFNKMSSSMSSSMSKVSSVATSGMAKVAAAVTAGMAIVYGAINSGANKSVSPMTSAFNKMASSGTSSSSKVAGSISNIGSSASSATNKVNSLAAAINGLKSKTITITANVAGKGASKLATGTYGAVSAFARIPAYAGGTGGGHQGGLALVNDGKGENYREAYMLPNGFIGLFPNKRNMIVDLPAGAHVLNGDDTKRKFGSGLTRYAEGTEGAVEAINNRKSSKANNGSNNQLAKTKTETKLSIGKIEININDTSGNAKDMADEIGRQVEKKLEEVLRKFNSNYSALGA
ncbi:Phage-related protein [Fructobacillus cardui]|uniref:tape measure protein n=1 Tax=Fructobacillus cardui TaxID=2893170 RepID=UPI002DB2000A|nr:Phage-related protein [Fructobacillus cardui]